MNWPSGKLGYRVAGPLAADLGPGPITVLGGVHEPPPGEIVFQTWYI
jgi:hypothetical protein